VRVGVCWAGVVAGLFCRMGLRVAGYEVAATVLTPGRMDALAIGGLIALAVRGPHGLEAIARWAAPVAGVLALLLAGLLASNTALTSVGYTVVALLCGAILIHVLTASSGGVTSKLFPSPTLRFFGRYCYYIYGVLH